MVGMIRRGMTSKMNRDNNHAVGLERNHQYEICKGLR